MVALNPPFSTAAVDVPEGLVDRYVADGWKRVGVSVDEPQRRPGRPKKTEGE